MTLHRGAFYNLFTLDGELNNNNKKRILTKKYTWRRMRKLQKAAPDASALSWTQDWTF